MFCVEKHTGQCRTHILHQKHVIVGNASVIKRSKCSIVILFSSIILVLARPAAAAVACGALV